MSHEGLDDAAIDSLAPSRDVAKWWREFGARVTRTPIRLKAREMTVLTEFPLTWASG